jgi:hypothetical protein
MHRLQTQQGKRKGVQAMGKQQQQQPAGNGQPQQPPRRKGVRITAAMLAAHKAAKQAAALAAAQAAVAAAQPPTRTYVRWQPPTANVQAELARLQVELTNSSHRVQNTHKLTPATCATVGKATPAGQAVGWYNRTAAKYYTVLQAHGTPAQVAAHVAAAAAVTGWQPPTA